MKKNITDIGMFPDSWELKKLKNCCEILNGDRSDKYPNGDDFVFFGIPFINAGHLQNGIINFSKMDYITKEHYFALSGAKIKRNDVLFCLRGSLGKFAIVDFH